MTATDTDDPTEGPRRKGINPAAAEELRLAMAHLILRNGRQSPLKSWKDKA